jgi:hypothetical protein
MLFMLNNPDQVGDFKEYVPFHPTHHRPGTTILTTTSPYPTEPSTSATSSTVNPTNPSR